MPVITRSQINKNVEMNNSDTKEMEQNMKTKIENEECIIKNMSNNICSICTNCIEITNGNYVTTECNHYFHSNCLIKNIAYNGYDCPLCRFTMTTIPEEEDSEEGDMYFSKEELERIIDLRFIGLLDDIEILNKYNGLLDKLIDERFTKLVNKDGMKRYKENRRRRFEERNRRVEFCIIG